MSDPYAMASALRAERGRAKVSVRLYESEPTRGETTTHQPPRYWLSGSEPNSLTVCRAGKNERERQGARARIFRQPSHPSIKSKRLATSTSQPTGEQREGRTSGLLVAARVRVQRALDVGVAVARERAVAAELKRLGRPWPQLHHVALERRLVREAVEPLVLRELVGLAQGVLEKGRTAGGGRRRLGRRGRQTIGASEWSAQCVSASQLAQMTAPGGGHARRPRWCCSWQAGRSPSR